MGGAESVEHGHENGLGVDRRRLRGRIVDDV
jgi:hypothetical protein